MMFGGYSAVFDSRVKVVGGVFVLGDGFSEFVVGGT